MHLWLVTSLCLLSLVLAAEYSLLTAENPLDGDANDLTIVRTKRETKPQNSKAVKHNSRHTLKQRRRRHRRRNSAGFRRRLRRTIERNKQRREQIDYYNYLLRKHRQERARKELKPEDKAKVDQILSESQSFRTRRKGELGKLLTEARALQIAKRKVLNEQRRHIREERKRRARELKEAVKRAIVRERNERTRRRNEYGQRKLDKVLDDANDDTSTLDRTQHSEQGDAIDDDNTDRVRVDEQPVHHQQGNDDNMTLSLRLPPHIYEELQGFLKKYDGREMELSDDKKREIAEQLLSSTTTTTTTTQKPLPRIVNDQNKYINLHLPEDVYQRFHEFFHRYKINTPGDDVHEDQSGLVLKDNVPLDEVAAGDGLSALQSLVSLASSDVHINDDKRSHLGINLTDHAKKPSDNSIGNLQVPFRAKV